MNMENLILNESSLSRIWKHSQDHDIGTITAFRHDDACGDGQVYSKSQNKARNKSLKSKLLAKRYSVTAALGVYVENYGSKNERKVKEEIFIVVDIADNNKLKKDLKSLGNEFDQDSILYIPKGGETGSLIGTGDCPDAYPSKGQIMKLKNALFGQSGEFHTRVNGRPFTLKESVGITKTPPQAGFFTAYGVYLESRKNWKELVD